MSKRSLPPRWKRCPRFGSIIADAFVPLKVPLDESYHSLLQPMEYFNPKMFIDSIHNLKKKIGLWIDLTNTSRFYDKTIIEDNRIQYFKLKCRGHKETPTAEQVQIFMSKCSRFLNSNPDSLIAVHCTHGFNRTGFLIASYLVEIMNWDIRAAINVFANARPPGIYKQDYLNELLRIYDDEDAPKLSAPALPDWCNEDAKYDDDDEVRNNLTSTSNVRENSEDIVDLIPGIVPLNDPNKITNVQAICSNMCSFRKKGFPGAQPVSLSHENLHLLAQEKYKVSWKADGTRYMMLILNPEECYLFDRDYKVFQLLNVKFLKKNESISLVNTLLDGEMVIDIFDGKNFPRYLIYDIIYCDGKDVSQEDFESRLNIIYKQIISPREQAKKAGIIDRTKEPIGIRIKQFLDIHLTYSFLSEKFQKSVSHEIDGLIFQPIKMSYKAGRCDCILKWKPPSHNSIDFKLRVVKEHRPGMLEDYIGHLYVGGFDRPFDQIPVTKAIRALNNKIIECRYNLQKRCWELMRERTDKSFPNALTTAKNVLQTIMHPINKEDLLRFIQLRCAPPSKK